MMCNVTDDSVSWFEMKLNTILNTFNFVPLTW